jgi:hypothetical protein
MVSVVEDRVRYEEGMKSMHIPESLFYWLVLRGKSLAAEVQADTIHRRAWVTVTPMLLSRFGDHPTRHLQHAPRLDERERMVFEVAYIAADRQEVKTVLRLRQDPNLIGWPDLEILTEEQYEVTSLAEVAQLVATWLPDLTQLRSRWKINIP